MASNEHTTRSTPAERADRVQALVKQTLWDQPLHPASSFEAEKLFSTLMGSKKGHVLHNQEGDLHIFHYGQIVQNQACWTPELLLARGLVFCKDQSGCRVVATPWPKFFNLGEDGIPLEDLEAAVIGGRIEATSKMDGSLGLLFHHEGEWRVTTKGSFASTQGQWATEWLHTHVNLSALRVGMTYLVEIIYPENRIVIPYNFSTLVLLSAFDVTGRELERSELEKVAAATRLEEPEPEPEPQLDVANVTVNDTYVRFGVVGAGMSGLSLPALHSADNLKELMQVVNSWPGTEREGVVVRFIFPSGASHRVKIKGTSYSALHRIKDGVSKKKIHEAARKSQAKLDELRNAVPEELLPEFDAVVDELDQACTATLRDVAEQWELAKRTLFAGSDDITNKMLAKYTQRHSSWRDGTTISHAFRACMFLKFMPHTKGACNTGIRTEPGAWSKLDHPGGRGTLLRYVLQQIERGGPKSSAQ